jgi:hypothetical protein
MQNDNLGTILDDLDVEWWEFARLFDDSRRLTVRNWAREGRVPRRAGDVLAARRILARINRRRKAVNPERIKSLWA